MWARAVVAALAVWCASDVAMAAGYKEVWNPPESAGGHAKHPTKKAVVADRAAVGQHAGSGSHRAAHVVSTQATGADHGRGGKPVAHGGVKKVAAKPTPTHGAARMPALRKPRTKTTATAQAERGRWQLAGSAKPDTESRQTRAAHAQTTRVAAKPKGANATETVLSANGGAGGAGGGIGGGATGAVNDPATARSGSLPPIIH